MTIEAIGWLSAIMLGLCGLPQAIRAVRTKSIAGLDPWFLGMWTAGELAGLVYVIALGNPALILNYLVNSVACCVLVMVHLGEAR
jgi:uncharacterized protein with PQ loop repeat